MLRVLPNAFKGDEILDPPTVTYGMFYLSNDSGNNNCLLNICMFVRNVHECALSDFETNFHF